MLQSIDAGQGQQLMIVFNQGMCSFDFAAKLHSSFSKTFITCASLTGALFAMCKKAYIMFTLEYVSAHFSHPPKACGKVQIDYFIIATAMSIARSHMGCCARVSNCLTPACTVATVLLNICGKE